MVSELVTIEKLKYLNLEINTGKLINTKENINIRCRINSSEEHIWHSSQGQLNLLVDLVHNLYITWGKRQDDLDTKLERLYKEHRQIEEKYSSIHNKLNLALQILEEGKTEQHKYCQNSDYIKEEVSLLHKKLDFKRIVREQEESSLVLASAGIVSSTIAINSDKWNYLKVSAEETNLSS